MGFIKEFGWDCYIFNDKEGDLILLIFTDNKWYIYDVTHEIEELVN